MTEKLTPQQQKVADLVVLGMSNKEIAESMGVGLATVKAHLTVVFAKSLVKNRSQLILKTLNSKISGSVDREEVVAESFVKTTQSGETVLVGGIRG